MVQWNHYSHVGQREQNIWAFCTCYRQTDTRVKSEGVNGSERLAQAFQ